MIQNDGTRDPKVSVIGGNKPPPLQKTVFKPVSSEHGDEGAFQSKHSFYREMQLGYQPLSQQVCGALPLCTHFSDVVVKPGMLTSEADRLQTVVHTDWKRKCSCPGKFVMDNIMGDYYRIVDSNLVKLVENPYPVTAGKSQHVPHLVLLEYSLDSSSNELLTLVLIRLLKSLMLILFNNPCQYTQTNVFSKETYSCI